MMNGEKILTVVILITLVFCFTVSLIFAAELNKLRNKQEVTTRLMTRITADVRILEQDLPFVKDKVSLMLKDLNKEYKPGHYTEVESQLVEKTYDEDMGVFRYRSYAPLCFSISEENDEGLSSLTEDIIDRINEEALKISA